MFADLLEPRERSSTRKNAAVGQAQLGPALQVSVHESAMCTPRHRRPALVITRSPQPGKFMRHCRPEYEEGALHARAGCTSVTPPARESEETRTEQRDFRVVQQRWRLTRGNPKRGKIDENGLVQE